MQKENLTDNERNNKIVMVSHFIMAVVMSTFCLLQTLSGLQTWFYMLIIVILGFFPVLLEFVFRRRNPGTSGIKHIMAVGFIVFYTFSIFTASNNLVFLFVIPMILIASVYNDTKFTILINIVTIFESLLINILGSKTGNYGYAGGDSAIIQVVIMILVAVYSYLTAQTIHRNLTQKLVHISSIAGQTKEHISSIYEDLEQLNESAIATKTAMEDVASGAMDTADAVQNQLQQTESIQNQVGIVHSTASQISDSLNRTLTFIEHGNQDVAQLVAQTESSVLISADAVDKLNTLDKKMKEMHAILKLIDDIAFQTNIMALNANIEAARAGEAGRGFSVVASQISNMSVQTKDATEQITGLIQNVSAAIGEVVNVMNQMIEGIHKGEECTAHTSFRFSSIRTNTFAIHDHVNQLMQNIAELTEANHLISDSIQTISAVSEEVSALAHEAMQSEQKNTEVLGTISDKMQGLLEITTEKQ